MFISGCTLVGRGPPSRTFDNTRHLVFPLIVVFVVLSLASILHAFTRLLSKTFITRR